MINTILVGFGFSATTFHLPFLTTLEEFNITGVVSSRPDDVRAVLPDVDVYATLEEAIATDATLFVITTPSNLHKDMVTTCLDANKDVLVEKPAFLTSEEGESLIALEKTRDGIVNVFHNRRMDGDFLTVASLLESNRIGDWKVYESRFDRFRPHVRDRWRENAGPGSGILFDLGSHLIDQALVLFGEPDHVSADVMVQRDGGQSDDGFNVTLHYGEKRVYLRSNPFVAVEAPRFEVHGTAGSFMKYGLDPQEAALRDGTIEAGVSETGTLVVNEPQTIEIEPGRYLAFYRQLADSYSTRRPVVPLEDALLTTRVIELARQSSRTQTTLSFE
ncbi:MULTISPECIES: Gfo/Idh/MocA family oxidoreductase [unclassified Exiguobacterium]|uniref:Gfo/Idh/MocA family oxidoreductase n=1 Tax=unclassified Exiguobacterium TaxID=2644629 RepID=UPI00103AA4EE|nr:MULTISPECIES: Gfo/Idh/MocA family oxidoreductase [unclassified Exiguobacterium]TCI43532.1 oxidoreductase [Exiguobacterium sp. SH5S32]TCI52478.1 oxidoreductase [Exiguobacterium sp. SH1S4]TCI68787.1 oxidoreductase [Exiguobacterium sp. SH1S1]